MPPMYDVPPPQPQRKSPISMVVLVVILLVLAGIAFGGSWYIRMMAAKTPAPAATTTVTYAQVRDALSSNISFQQGSAALAAGRYADAVTSFTAALESTTDASQRIATESLLAVAYERLGQNVNAIRTFKDIVASNVPKTSRARAYAVQQMGHLYYTYGKDTNVTGALFSDAPYASMLVANDPTETLINIFKYSAGEYPLAASLYELADLYADKLIALQSAKGDNATVDSYKTDIQKYVGQAEQDVAYMRGIDSLNLQLQEALSLKAITLGKLAESGDEDEATANQAFEDSITAYANANGGAGGSVRYYYAVELARLHGKASAEKIHAVLSPLYTDVRYKGSQIEKTLSSKNFANKTQDKDLALLISIDSGFKSYLSSLGWTAADFSALTR